MSECMSETYFKLTCQIDCHDLCGAMKLRNNNIAVISGRSDFNICCVNFGFPIAILAKRPGL